MPDNEESCHLVRVILGARMPKASMLVVSAALDDDGAAELALGLASAFTEAGKKTALVSLHDTREIASGNTVRDDSFCCPSYQAPMTPIALDALISKLRAEYHVVIVASPPVANHSAALQLCGTADGVLLAVRLGRRVVADDENTVTQLQRVNARLFGVIAMQPPAPQKPLGSPDLVIVSGGAAKNGLQQWVSSLMSAALSLPTLVLNRLRGSAQPSATENMSLR